jgi:branched-subunit amino acid ABC-type transport system permease component
MPAPRAIGCGLAFGVLLMINSADGESIMLDIFGAGPLSQSGFIDCHPVLALLAAGSAAMPTSIFGAVFSEGMACRPLRYAPRRVPPIAANGALISAELPPRTPKAAGGSPGFASRLVCCYVSNLT